MYVSMVIKYYIGVWINRVRLPLMLARGQLNNRENWLFPCPRLRLRTWSRETGSAVPPIPHTQAESSIINHQSSIINLVLTEFLPISAAASIYLIIPPYAIGLGQSRVYGVITQVSAYRWRSLPPRVRRQRARSPQSSSSNGCCLGRSPWTN